MLPSSAVPNVGRDEYAHEHRHDAGAARPGAVTRSGRRSTAASWGSRIPMEDVAAGAGSLGRGGLRVDTPAPPAVPVPRVDLRRRRLRDGRPSMVGSRALPLRASVGRPPTGADGRVP